MDRTTAMCLIFLIIYILIFLLIPIVYVTRLYFSEQKKGRIIMDYIEENEILNQKVDLSSVLKEYRKILITDEMRDDRQNCGEDSDCENCSCRIGTDSCVFEYSVLYEANRV